MLDITNIDSSVPYLQVVPVVSSIASFYSRLKSVVIAELRRKDPRKSLTKST